MADKAFGVKDINLIGASGTPTIESPNNLNINAVNVAISTDITVAGKVSLGAGTSISSPGSNILTLGTNSVERVRIDSSGRTIVGTTSLPGDQLVQIYGANTSAAGVFISNATAAVDEEASITFAPANDITGGQIKCIAEEDFTTGANRTARLAFYTRKDGTLSEKIRITPDGNLKFASSGLGIDFSATTDSGGMTSELLNDYEEGTWTPGISGRTVTGASEGTYTKIGRQVLLRFLLAGIDSSLTSADVNISGIPYTSANINQNGACLICDSSGVSYATNFGDIYGRVNGNSTVIQLLQKRTDGSSHDWFGVGGGLSTGVILRGYAWYTT